MTSQMFGCCTLKAWALTISWIHIVMYSFLAFTYTILLLIIAVDGTDRAGFSEHSTAAAVIAILILSGVCVGGVLLGILLLRAVRDENVERLRFWLIWESILTSLRALALIIGIASSNTATLSSLIGLCFNLFAIYVIYQHRKEILQEIPVFQSQPPVVVVQSAGDAGNGPFQPPVFGTSQHI